MLCYFEQAFLFLIYLWTNTRIASSITAQISLGGGNYSRFDRYLYSHKFIPFFTIHVSCDENVIKLYSKLKDLQELLVIRIREIKFFLIWSYSFFVLTLLVSVKLVSNCATSQCVVVIQMTANTALTAMI